MSRLIRIGRSNQQGFSQRTQTHRLIVLLAMLLCSACDANALSIPVIRSSTSASGVEGSAFSYQIIATNSPFEYKATSLPADLTLNSKTGLVSGTPTVTGTYDVTLSATNRRGTGTAILTITISGSASGSVPVISSAATASGTEGSAFSYQITASNSPTSFGATGLPAGLSINSATGLISGTPTAAGTSAISLSASNSGGTGNATLTLTINSGASTSSVTITPSILSFGNQPVDTTSSALVATLSNSGSAALTISTLGITGTNASNYIETTTCGATLPAGEFCTIAVQFTPAAFGACVASLNISDSASSSPQTVALSGSGTHDVILSWTRSTTYGIVGYNVYRGTTSGGEDATPLNSSPVTGVTFADSTVQAGEGYFYYITAVASGGTQSLPSNEVSATVPSQ